MVGMVKNNTKLLCKETIDILKNNCRGGSYLVLNRKHMVPRDRSIIAIGYKYNTWKVLSVIVTEDTGSTNSGIPYLSKYS